MERTKLITSAIAADPAAPVASANQGPQSVCCRFVSRSPRILDLAEMIEAHGCNRSLLAVGTAQTQTGDVGHRADLIELGRSRGVGDEPRGVIGRDDHAKLEVFAVVERVIECGRSIPVTHIAGIGMDGNRRRVEYCPEAAALGEDVPQVGRESIRDIDQGGDRD